MNLNLINIVSANQQKSSSLQVEDKSPDSSVFLSLLNMFQGNEDQSDVEVSNPKEPHQLKNESNKSSFIPDISQNFTIMFGEDISLPEEQIAQEEAVSIKNPEEVIKGIKDSYHTAHTNESEEYKKTSKIKISDLSNLPLREQLKLENSISEAESVPSVKLENTVSEPKPITEIKSEINVSEPKPIPNMKSEIAFLVNDIIKNDLVNDEDVHVSETFSRTEANKIVHNIGESINNPPRKLLSFSDSSAVETTQQKEEVINSISNYANEVDIGSSNDEVAKANYIDTKLPANNLQIMSATSASTPVIQTAQIIQNSEYVKLVPSKFLKNIDDLNDSRLSNPQEIAFKDDFKSSVEPLVKGFDAVAFEREEVEFNQQSFQLAESLQVKMSDKFAAKLYEARQLESFKGSDNVPQQITVNLMKSLDNGHKEMTFKLSPAELGEVNIKFESNDSGITKITILTEKFTTFDSLSKSVQQIENILTQNGFKQEGLTIDVGLKENSPEKNFQQNNNDQRFAYNEEADTEVEVINFRPSHEGLLNIMV